MYQCLLGFTSAEGLTGHHDFVKEEAPGTFQRTGGQTAGEAAIKGGYPRVGVPTPGDPRNTPAKRHSQLQAWEHDRVEAKGLRRASQGWWQTRPSPWSSSEPRLGQNAESRSQETWFSCGLKSDLVTSRLSFSAREYAHKRDMRRAVPNPKGLCS